MLILQSEVPVKKWNVVSFVWETLRGLNAWIYKPNSGECKFWWSNDEFSVFSIRIVSNIFCIWTHNIIHHKVSFIWICVALGVGFKKGLDLVILYDIWLFLALYIQLSLSNNNFHYVLQLYISDLSIIRPLICKR